MKFIVLAILLVSVSCVPIILQGPERWYDGTSYQQYYFNNAIFGGSANSITSWTFGGWLKSHSSSNPVCVFGVFDTKYSSHRVAETYFHIGDGNHIHYIANGYDVYPSGISALKNIRYSWIFYASTYNAATKTFNFHQFNTNGVTFSTVRVHSGSALTFSGSTSYVYVGWGKITSRKFYGYLKGVFFNPGVVMSLSQLQQFAQGCHQNCLECTGPGANQCTVCKTDFYLKSGECVADCGKDFYADIASGACSQCSWNWSPLRSSVTSQWCTDNCYDGAMQLHPACLESSEEHQTCQCNCPPASFTGDFIVGGGGYYEGACPNHQGNICSTWRVTTYGADPYQWTNDMCQQYCSIAAYSFCSGNYAYCECSSFV